MSEKKRSAFAHFLNEVFPRMPDFLGLLNEQCDVAVQALAALVEFLEDGQPAAAIRVRDLEHEGDRLKLRNTDILNRSFATPFDREDIYRAIDSIDHVINYAKTTVRELEALKLDADPYSLEMAVLLSQGTESLCQGYRKLSQQPLDAEPDAKAARKAERSVEKVYRRAIAELFDEDAIAALLRQGGDDAIVKTMMAMIGMHKRREIYRHLSNAADRLARAGDILHNIIVKNS